VANKSPQKSSGKKPGKSLKEKRAAKKAKQAPTKIGTAKPA
jgi:hypothetical protein